MADKACSDGTHSFSSSHSAYSSSSPAGSSSSHAASSSSAPLDASIALALALQREEDESSARDAQLAADEALARQLSGEGRLPPPPPEVHSELYQAASCGDLEAGDRLLADGRPADSGVSKFATTPLMVATRHGHRDVAKALLKAGASPTPVSYTHLTLPTTPYV